MQLKNKDEINSNRAYWQKLQDDELYFDNHPIYQGSRDFNLKDYGGYDASDVIDFFIDITPKHKVVVIGCGYGRDSLQIAPRCEQLWGIDVSEKLLTRAKTFLNEAGIHNFTPVLASDYSQAIPDNIDLVFSVVVMQHLTRDLVRDYFEVLSEKLSSNGCFIVQFLEELYDGVETQDAELKVYEPSISWTSNQLAKLAQDCKLQFNEIRTQMINPQTLWHWAYFSKS